MRGIFFTVIYFSVCVCFLYLIEFMSTTDLTSIVPPSEDIEMDGTEEQSVDHQKEEQKQSISSMLLLLVRGQEVGRCT